MSSRMLAAIIFAVFALTVAAVAFAVVVETLSKRRSPRVSTTPAAPDSTLVFADEFESQLDPAKWVTCHWWAEGGCTIATNEELEWYRPEEVIVRDGRLSLRAERRQTTAPDGKVFPFSSGMISSGRETPDMGIPPRFAFQYGFLEIRARLPVGRGLWPAVWMLPATHESLPEVDVAEVYGHDPSTIRMRLHPGTLNGEPPVIGEEFSGLNDPSGWHTFGLDWEIDRLVWYVDGAERWRVEGDAVPREPMYLVVNLAVGGTRPGPPDADTVFPAHLDLDYVRVRQEAA